MSTPRPGATPGPAAAAARPHWPELDTLRGIAALLMIASHCAVRTDPAAGSPFVEAAGFVGSFAPAVFFFLTGLGSGLQSARGGADRGGHFTRAGILLVADSFLWVAPERHAGLDFLGFIALSALGLHWLRRRPHSGVLAALLALAVVAVRYAVGPVVRPWAAGLPLADFLLGASPREGFAYPPLPWTAYPLAGYALGRLAGARRDWLTTHRWKACLVAAGVGGVFALAAFELAATGAVLFRWGTVSAAFFVASWAVVGLGVAAAFAVGERPAGVWALDGVRSLAVVPLHYLLLALADAVFGAAASGAEYARNLVLVGVVSFAASVLAPPVGRAVARLSPEKGRAVRAGLWLGVTVALMAVVAEWPGRWDSAVRGGAQLALCVLVAAGLAPTSPRRERPGA